jgi:hypothetical protein
MAFVSKADAKVRSFFELPKLFEVFFQKVFFEVEVRVSVPLFSISTHLLSLSIAGAKLLLYNISTKYPKHFFASFLNVF